MIWVDLGAVPATATAGSVSLAQNPEPPPGEGAEFGKASPIALVVILFLAVATILLIRSMTGRLKRLPASFDQQPEGERRE